MAPEVLPFTPGDTLEKGKVHLTRPYLWSACVNWWMLGNKILPRPPWTILPYSLPKVVLLLFSSVQGGVLHTLDSEDHKGLTQLTFKKAIATNYVLVFYVHTWNENYKNTLNL